MEWQEIIGQFQTVCRDPYTGAVEWKKQNGKKVFGWFLYDTPEEIIHASGNLPIAVMGTTKHLSRCDAYVQSFVCSLVRSTLEMGLDGSLAWLDGVVFPQVCDSAQNLPGVWDKNCPSPYSDSLFWAKSLTSPSARGYTIEEVKRFRQGLETYLGEKISDEAIQASIGVYNKSRGLLRQLASHTDKLTCREKYDILKAALLMPKEQFNSLAEKALEVLENKSPVAKERIPRFLSPVTIMKIMPEPIF
jgi:benzoyl-CoA reductase subunit C